MKILVLLFALVMSGTNMHSQELLPLKEYECSDASIKAFKMGYSKEYDEGYYNLALEVAGRKIDFKYFLEREVKGSLCTKIPVLKIQDKNFLVFTAIDDRPMPDKIYISLLNLDTLKITDEYKGQAFKAIFIKNNRAFFISRISRTDSIGTPEIKIDDTKFVLEESELSSVHSVGLDKDQKIEVKLDSNETYDLFEFKNFYKNKENFEKDFSTESNERWLYLLKDLESKKTKCIFITSERESYPKKSINDWRCL